MKIFASLATIVLLSFAPKTDKPKPTKAQLYVANYENVLGTSLEFKFTATTEADAENAEKAALKEIDRLSAVLSAYDQNSEFNNWMRHELNKPVKVSAELFNMLSLFDDWKKRTSGALNASAAVANQLWTAAASKNVLPSKAQLLTAVSLMQQKHYQLDKKNLTATRLTNVPLVMNTFAKSYIINLACDAALKSADITSAVVNIGGDLVIKGDVLDAVNVTNPLANAENNTPLAQLLVSNKAIATSGNYRRGNQIGKEWYAHIIDPRTAKPVVGVISATVIANNATDAGALATAFNVLSLSEAQNLAATIEGVAYLVVTKGGKMVESKNWNLFVDRSKKEEKNNVQAIMVGSEKAWDPKYELTINFEFNKIAGNSHRPFTAIWVENDKKEAVRNLALWFNKARWVPDLRNWYKINSVKFKADNKNYASVTGATRNPGKYTVKWDGKTDNGEFVPQGNYTINIETSKEHGTDEILRQTMELKKATKKVSNKGNVEISNVTFDFRKK
ncbi:DUF2271 domain-containing protein [Pedobacter cryotolerans]|uniref:FAD:protein FMN transferase n=1 Tax=Pedobacter cryotolerans TaxID=2571270 RepID=A0A4U1C9F9_9SPHI|nr:DUF2271 domain-containing protein [Pedobacter cryotolerans]TKC03073.1 DUF2271 domain-containing protein [Pedobacter cryotolerans]